jgi:hypothetical protein
MKLVLLVHTGGEGSASDEPHAALRRSAAEPEPAISTEPVT